MGLRNLPARSWQSNAAWMLAANLAADLDACLRLLTLHGREDLANAGLDTMRVRLHHLPARLARHRPAHRTEPPKFAAPDRTERAMLPTAIWRVSVLH